MEETMKNTTEELEEKELTTTEDENAEDPLKEAIQTQMRKLARQNMLLGAQTMCKVVLEKILVFEAKPGKRTMNDYKRLVKDVRNFCETGLSRKVNLDGETEPINDKSAAEETVQN